MIRPGAVLVVGLEDGSPEDRLPEDRAPEDRVPEDVIPEGGALVWSLVGVCSLSVGEG